LSSEERSELIRVRGLLEAFGFASTETSVTVIARPASWRMTRAILTLLVAWGMAPLVFFIPPHFPWAIAALLGGVYFARRFSMERFTLVSLDGPCARCGTPVRQEPRTRLKRPHTLYCPACGQELLLRVEI